MTAEARPWLAPLGWAFGGAAALRAGLHRAGILRAARLDGPVISVGNLAVGGRGKTPMVIRVAEILRDAGQPVAVLSRGYGGSFRGAALVVSDGRSTTATADEAGDEPVLIARRLPGVVVAVGRRRADAGREVERRFGPRVHVLDDGFQHLALHRDLDLVCALESDLRSRPLPAGPLREFPSALSRADLLLVEGDAGPPAGLAVAGPRRLTWRRRVSGFVGAEGTGVPAPRVVFAVSGIARPDRFASDLRAAGCEVVGERRFPDHHPFREADLASVESAARKAGAQAVATTEKDLVRLPAGRLGLPVLALRIAPALDDEDALRAVVLATARGDARERRPA